MIRLISILLVSVFLSLPVFSDDFQYTYKQNTDRDPMASLLNEKGQIITLEIEKERLKKEEEKKVIEKKAEETKPVEKKATDLVLQGIIFRDDGSAAILGNELYYEGDMVEKKFKIIKILPNGITVQGDDQEYFIKWGG